MPWCQVMIGSRAARQQSRGFARMPAPTGAQAVLFLLVVVLLVLILLSSWQVPSELEFDDGDGPVRRGVGTVGGRRHWVMGGMQQHGAEDVARTRRRYYQQGLVHDMLDINPTAVQTVYMPDVDYWEVKANLPAFNSYLHSTLPPLQGPLDSGLVLADKSAFSPCHRLLREHRNLALTSACLLPTGT